MVDRRDDIPDVLFSAVLTPHRSAPRRALKTVILLVGFVFAVVGTVFVLVGAWPVLGFMGAEVAGLAIALLWNFRTGRAMEEIRLTSGELEIQRTDHWGRRQRFSFQPAWLQVLLEERRGTQGHLMLRSHGRSMSIGGFLTVDEKRTLARALKDAIRSGSSPHRAAPA